MTKKVMVTGLVRALGEGVKVPIFRQLIIFQFREECTHKFDWIF